MTNQESTRSKPRITGAHTVATDSHVTVQSQADGVSIIVTQLFGPTGENLIGNSGHSFEGYKAFTLLVKSGDREELVHLSPIHGDNRKVGMEGLAPGSKCELFCPISKQPLDQVLEVPEDLGTEYFALYLTPQLRKGSYVLISNVWGHYHSRVVDNFELISAWMPDAEPATAALRD